MNFFKNIVLAAAVAAPLGLASCVDDLDVTPIDPSTNMTADIPALFTKCYANMAVAGNGGTPITATTTNGGSTWLFKSSRGHMGFPGNGTDIYLDAAQDVASWSIEPVSGTSYQYRIKSSNGTYLTTTPSESHKPIRRVSYNANDDNQKWVFLTDDRIRTEMTKANADYPFNFTALLKSADFDLIEYEDGWTNNWDGFDWSGGGTDNMTGNGPFKGACSGWNPDASTYVSYAYANSTSATTMSQNLGTLPNGTYNISFEGFYRSRYKSGTIIKTEKDVPHGTSFSIFLSTEIY